MEKRKRKATIFWIIVIASYLCLFGLEYMFPSPTTIATVGGYELVWGWGYFIFSMQFLYTLKSLKTIGPTELGARLLFGKPINPLSSGLAYIPWGICQLVKETGLTVQDEIPTDPQHIFRGDGPVPEGQYPPIRIPFGPPKTAEELKKMKITTEEGESLVIPPKDDPLNIRITVEVVPIIRWRIIDYIKFLTTIGCKEEASRQMEDSAIGSITREFTKVTPAVVLANIGIYNRKLQEEIQKRIENWGMILETAQVKTINLHHTLNEAIGSVPRATLSAEVVVIDAKATKKELKLHGEGEGAAEKAVLAGRTNGLSGMAKDLNVPAGIVIGAETARAITSNPGQKTIVAGTSGFKEIMAVGTAIAATVKGGGK